ncbi:MAG: peptidylglycine alpha-amidating monooxygenase, partial [Chloroflexota bacterium]|nr:peptidylglycine alpha-amidating monooxygenase [Chloroflexota bacterium]
MPSAPTSSTIYEPVAGWAKIPHGFWLREATSVAVDAQDRVYVFNRGNMPMLVFDADGNLIDHWGNATPHGGQHEIEDPYGLKRLVWDGVEYGWPHSVRVDPEGALWLVDVHQHQLTKTDTSGTPLMTLGGSPAPPQSGDPFNKPTDLAINPATGDIFVSDGYGNSRVHRYTAEGEHVLSW